jgi:hypothetical protein
LIGIGGIDEGVGVIVTDGVVEGVGVIVLVGVGVGLQIQLPFVFAPPPQLGLVLTTLSAQIVALSYIPTVIS